MATWDGVTDGRRVLAEGDRGEAVLELQLRLRRAGYRVPADGVFGAATERSVRDFQAGRGLFADGVVGRRTARALAPTDPR
ncbi:MAG: peptidoglycan-binding domain-containing protein [Myxococcota bacterium]